MSAPHQDMVLSIGAKDWLLPVDSVTSHGLMDAERHNELAELFVGSTASLVYLTAFPDFGVMGEFLSNCWESNFRAYMRHPT